MYNAGSLRKIVDGILVAMASGRGTEQIDIVEVLNWKACLVLKVIENRCGRDSKSFVVEGFVCHPGFDQTSAKFSSSPSSSSSLRYWLSWSMDLWPKELNTLPSPNSLSSVFSWYSS